MLGLGSHCPLVTERVDAEQLSLFLLQRGQKWITGSTSQNGPEMPGLLAHGWEQGTQGTGLAESCTRPPGGQTSEVTFVTTSSTAVGHSLSRTTMLMPPVCALAMLLLG